jgi:basic membrane lipoprotein Med (substrate-binding protein (PBP1-ABC) superfamily)
MAVLSSCISRDDNTAEIDSRPRLTVIAAISGAGDNGYNDKVLDGLMKFYESHDVAMSLIRPATIDEAKSVLHKWLSESGDNQFLLVLAGSDYETLMKAENITAGKNRNILLFESDDIPGISTFRIQRYGISYLAGCMASPHKEATVVAALPEEQILEDGILGFSEGYGAQSGHRANVVYLADDYYGYVMSDTAYRLASSLDEAFVYPLAGGSNNGLYKYSREHNFGTMLVAGMDVDCSAYSDRVPFSVIIRIDEVIEHYLDDWYQGKDMAGHQTFGLESGFVDIVISPSFYEETDIFEDYYQDDDYWRNAYNQYKAEALRKEAEYEAK